MQRVQRETNGWSECGRVKWARVLVVARVAGAEGTGREVRAGGRRVLRHSARILGWQTRPRTGKEGRVVLPSWFWRRSFHGLCWSRDPANSCLGIAARCPFQMHFRVYRPFFHVMVDKLEISQWPDYAVSLVSVDYM